MKGEQKSLQLSVKDFEKIYHYLSMVAEDCISEDEKELEHLNQIGKKIGKILDENNKIQ